MDKWTKSSSKKSCLILGWRSKCSFATIIESGLDIPNCNTLSREPIDLVWDNYQIRGRVGRFKRQAYAYLLTSIALDGYRPKTLKVIRQHNQLVRASESP